MLPHEEKLLREFWEVATFNVAAYLLKAVANPSHAVYYLPLMWRSIWRIYSMRRYLRRLSQ